MIDCVFHLLYQVFYAISICSIYNNEVRDIFERNMLSSVRKLAYNWLCFIDQTHWQMPNTALNMYSSCLCFHPLHHNHDIKEAFIMCHSYPFPVNFKKTLTACCHLPKPCTCPLHLFCLLHSNSQIVKFCSRPNENFRRSSSQIQLPHADRNINSWKHNNLRYHPLMQSK